ncbi:citrate (Si)-synthase, partial [bacterium]|nr:citrate (Si)-synthase [bacterium]
VQQIYGGMRGVKGLICDTSLVEPDTGLVIRGRPIGELTDKLPEEIFYLLLTGELPNKDELKELQKEYQKRSGVPQYVWNVLKAMPADSHPMCMLDTGILVMEHESVFRKKYTEGMNKMDYWDPMYEDCLNLLAKLPELAAGVYRIRFKKGDLIKPKADLDWGSNYAYMMGLPDPKGDFAKLMQLYLTLHCDHEGGNVSAYSCHTVGSALSDIYYSVSAGMNGLAGPLHGLANQECLKFVLEVYEKYNKKCPDNETLKKLSWDLLNSGQVIPGYGHAVLRVTDPRFTAFLAFGKKYMANDEVFKIVQAIFEVVPVVLKEQGKVKDPWPNVDAGSGALLYHYGVTEFDYYTVLFAVSRTMGLAAQMILNRAIGSAIVRPKSVGTDWVKKTVSK